MQKLAADTEDFQVVAGRRRVTIRGVMGVPHQLIRRVHPKQAPAVAQKERFLMPLTPCYDANVAMYTVISGVCHYKHVQQHTQYIHASIAVCGCVHCQYHSPSRHAVAFEPVHQGRAGSLARRSSSAVVS